MADENLRALERRAAQGDLEAKAALEAAKVRVAKRLPCGCCQELVLERHRCRRCNKAVGPCCLKLPKKRGPRRRWWCKACRRGQPRWPSVGMDFINPPPERKRRRRRPPTTNADGTPRTHAQHEQSFVRQVLRGELGQAAVGALLALGAVELMKRMNVWPTLPPPASPPG